MMVQEGVGSQIIGGRDGDIVRQRVQQAEIQMELYCKQVGCVDHIFCYFLSDNILSVGYVTGASDLPKPF